MLGESDMVGVEKGFGGIYCGILNWLINGGLVDCLGWCGWFCWLIDRVFS